MNRRSGSQSSAGLVNRYIGSAFDTVKIVADSIDDVVEVASNIEAVEVVASNIEDLQSINENMEVIKTAAETTTTNVENAVTAQELAETARDESVAARDEVLNRIDSYEVESTEYLINTFDSSALQVGEVVKTLGYSGAETGASKWVKTSSTGTPSQSPIDLIDGKLTTSNGDVFDLVSDGCVNVFSFGAVNSTVSTENSTGAFAAMASHCLSTGDSWVANGDFYVDSVDAYTSTESNCVLHSSNDSESVAVLSVLPNPDDIASETDFSSIQSSLPFYEGQTNIPALGAYVGKVVHIACADIYLPRIQALESNYRYEMYCHVLNEAGDISPAVPHDFPDTVTIAVLNTEVLQDKLTIKGVSTNLTGSDAGGRLSSVYSNRSRVDFQSTVVNNDTGLQVAQGFEFDGVMYNHGVSCSANGCKIQDTNYGYNFSGASNSLFMCNESDNRRGADQTYHNDMKIIGGSYPSGIGGHFGFNTKISDVGHIGWTDQNLHPLHFSGGSVSVDNCDIFTTEGVFDVRFDGPELIGSVIVTNSRITFQIKDETGSPIVHLFESQFPALGYGYPTGRDLITTEKVSFINNKINVQGVNHTAILLPFNIYTEGTVGTDVVLSSEFTFRDNTYNFENGNSHVKINSDKLAAFSDSSAGLDIQFLDHVDYMDSYIANSTDYATGPRMNLYAPNVKEAAMRVDYGWAGEFYVSNCKYSNAVGTTYDPSHRWMSSLNNQPWFARLRIEDDSAIELSGVSLFSCFEIQKLGFSNAYAKIIAEAGGTSSFGKAYASDNVATVSNVALDGTSGVDGFMTISQVSDSLYIENRLGSGMHISLKLEEFPT